MNMTRLLMVVATVASLATAAARGQEIRDAVTDLLPRALNVVTYSAPRSMTLSALGLEKVGLVAGDVFPLSDEIRIFSNRDAMKESPKARLWLNLQEGGRLWYYKGGEGYAGDLELQAGEVLVIYTRVSTKAIAWQNPLAETK